MSDKQTSQPNDHFTRLLGIEANAEGTAVRVRLQEKSGGVMDCTLETEAIKDLLGAARLKLGLSGLAAGRFDRCMFLVNSSQVGVSTGPGGKQYMAVTFQLDGGGVVHFVMSHPLANTLASVLSQEASRASTDGTARN